MGDRDYLKQSQGSSYERIELPIAGRLDVREHEGNIVFRTIKKTEDGIEEIFIDTPIEGVLIGKAMKLEAFSRGLGSKGGSYVSSYYFTNELVVLFRPGQGGYKKFYAGDMKGAEAALVTDEIAPAKAIKKKQVFFVQRKEGLIEIMFNLSLAIDGLRNKKDEFINNQIILTPALYDPDDPDISKKCKETYLGPLAATNPPKYAKVSIGSPITDQMEKEWELKDLVKLFVKWREQYKPKEKPKEDVEPGRNLEQEFDDMNADDVKDLPESETKKTDKQTKIDDKDNKQDDSDNDLPF